MQKRFEQDNEMLTEYEQKLLEEYGYEDAVKEFGYIDPKRFLLGMQIMKDHRSILQAIGED